MGTAGYSNSFLKHALLLQPRGFLKGLYPQALWHLPRTDKCIYLTFDDGPVAGITEWVLDELARAGAKATFFCVGDNINRYPGVFERIRNEGHLAANHTMFHAKGFKTSIAAYLKQVEDCGALLDNRLFRPPYGQLKRGQYRSLIAAGYQVVFWDVISYDYETISARRCAGNVIRNTKNGSIVLFHDSLKAEKNLKHALPLFLKYFGKQGYSFRTLQAV